MKFWKYKQGILKKDEDNDYSLEESCDNANSLDNKNSNQISQAKNSQDTTQKADETKNEKEDENSNNDSMKDEEQQSKMENNDKSDDSKGSSNDTNKDSMNSEQSNGMGNNNSNSSGSSSDSKNSSQGYNNDSKGSGEQQNGLENESSRGTNSSGFSEDSNTGSQNGDGQQSEIGNEASKGSSSKDSSQSFSNVSKGQEQSTDTSNTNSNDSDISSSDSLQDFNNDSKGHEQSNDNKANNSDAESSDKTVNDLNENIKKHHKRKTKKERLIEKRKKLEEASKRKRKKLKNNKKQFKESNEEKYDKNEELNSFFEKLGELPSFEERDRGDGYSIDTDGNVELPNSLIRTLITKFLNQRFCKKNTDLNVRSNSLEKTKGFYKWEIKDVIIHLETEQITKVFDDKYGYDYANGRNENVPLSFYFDMSGSMNDYTNLLSVIAIELLKKGVKVLIGYNEKVNVQIESVDKNIDIETLSEVLCKAGYYSDYYRRPFNNAVTRAKGIKYKLVERNLDNYLVQNKAEKCVVFADFDPIDEVINLSNKAQVYWFCFESNFNKCDLDDYNGFIYKVEDEIDIAKGLIKVTERNFKSLCYIDNPVKLRKVRK